MQVDFEKLYKEDVNNYIDIVQRYSILIENDHIEAFELMKDSLVVWDRFTVIRADVLKILGRGECVWLKKSLEDKINILEEIHRDVRATFLRAKDGLRVYRD